MTTTSQLSPSDDEVGGQLEKSPSFVEQQFVHDVYNEIAHCFSSPVSARKNRRWPNVVAFLDSLDEGSLVCDVGCGDGKYMATDAALTGRLSIVSVDLCANLLKTAQLYASKTPSCDVVASNNLALAFRNECFDAVVSVGVLHHFSTVERRIQALRELGRLLKPNAGRLLVYVWALEQPKRHFSAQDILVPSDVDASPEDSKLQKMMSTNPDYCSAATTDFLSLSWPTRNGQMLIFEEFPNWWNSNTVMLSSSLDNLLAKLNDEGKGDSNVPSKGENSPEDDRKLSFTAHSHDSKISTTATGSPSFFSRMLPSFLRKKVAKGDADSAKATSENSGSSLLLQSTSAASSPAQTTKHAKVMSQKSLYRYYHVFCRGELEKLIDSLNRECCDPKHHLQFIRGSTSSADQEPPPTPTPISNEMGESQPPLRRPSSSLPSFEDVGKEKDAKSQPQVATTASDTLKMHLKIVRSFYDHANWAVELERVY